jgi:hypothetical protein
MPQQVCTRIDPVSLIQNQNEVSEYCTNQKARLFPDSYHKFDEEKRYGSSVPQMSAADPVGIIYSMVIFPFYNCVITLS